MTKTRKTRPLNSEVRHQLHEEYLKLEAQRNEKSMKKSQSDEFLYYKILSVGYVAWNLPLFFVALTGSDARNVLFINWIACTVAMVGRYFYDALTDYQKDLLKIGFISLLFYFNVQDGVFWIGCSPTGFLWLIAAVGTIYFHLYEPCPLWKSVTSI